MPKKTDSESDTAASDVKAESDSKTESKSEKKSKLNPDEAVTTESLAKRPEVEKAVDAAADQRNATGGQSGFGSEVPAKLAEQGLIDEDGKATPKAKREQAAREGTEDSAEK